jgi:hypothetical protein
VLTEQTLPDVKPKNLRSFDQRHGHEDRRCDFHVTTAMAESVLGTAGGPFTWRESWTMSSCGTEGVRESLGARRTDFEHFRNFAACAVNVLGRSVDDESSGLGIACGSGQAYSVGETNQAE